MPGFPDQFRDLAGFSSQGLSYSTPSNTAVKMLDALINQAIYHYNDEQLGGWAGTAEKMFEADPDFAMGKIFTLGLECFASNREKTAEPRKKLFDLSSKSKTLNLTSLEKMHLKAAELMTSEDYYGAMVAFEDILAKYPLDAYALHMAYFLALTTGHTSRLRDTPASVVKEYKPGMPFYGHVHGKLCFGQGEMGDYEASEISGRLALDHFPLDNWSHHALAHNFEESGRALQGSKFLQNSEPQWTQGTTFSHHLWWHTSLFYVQLGEFESALTLYDDTIGPMTLKDGGNFPLSDGSALLMRLQLEGVDIGDRAREQAAKWESHDEDFVSLFYDGHSCFTNLMAGNMAENTKWMENMREYIAGDRKGWNKEVTEKVGLPLMEGITQFFAGDYARAVEILNPVMPDVQKMIQGSGAQKDIFQQILLHSCVRSGTPGDLANAREMMDQKLVRRKIKEHTPLNKRFMEKMMTVHQTQG